MSVLVIVVVLAVLLWQFSRSFWAGLSCAVGFLVSLPNVVQVPLPGSLPALTVHRLIVLLVLCFWLRESHNRVTETGFPFKAVLWCILGTQVLSVLFGVELVSSLKAFCYYALENVLFLYVLVTVTRDRDDGAHLVRGMCAGLFAVAILAFIEKYRGYSPMQYFPGYYDGTVMATFSHRILLGTAMAMGWPLCMYWAALEETPKRRALAWLAACMCIGSCYFAQSRGPWMGVVLAALTVGVLGSGKQRKLLIGIGALALLVWMSNSGVRATIQARVGSTFDDDSQAQVSYQWRWELWRKAWKEITKSPTRMAFGYGPGSSEALNWEGEVSFLNYQDSFSSWDNNWAAYLLECGLLGFAVLLCFYVAVGLRLWNIWRHVRGRDKEFAAFIAAAVVVYTFMQTNVKIFAPQVNYIFWIALAVGIGLERQPHTDELMESVEQPLEPVAEGA